MFYFLLYIFIHFLSLHVALLVFILKDLRSHFELALAWLYAEYCIEEQLVATPSTSLQYENCLIGLMKGAHDKLDSRDRYLTITCCVLNYCTLTLLYSFILHCIIVLQLMDTCTSA